MQFELPMQPFFFAIWPAHDLKTLLEIMLNSEIMTIGATSSIYSLGTRTAHTTSDDFTHKIHQKIRHCIFKCGVSVDYVCDQRYLHSTILEKKFKKTQSLKNKVLFTYYVRLRERRWVSAKCDGPKKICVNFDGFSVT